MSESERRVRAAGPEDAGAITEVFLEARRESMPYLPTLHTDEATARWIRETVVGGLEVYVATAGDRVEGFVALDGPLLAHLYVAPGRQGGGAGSALLAHAKRARQAGFRLYVFQRNERARRFYESRGLALVSLGDGSGNEEGEPDALYEWRPPSV